MFPTLRLYLGGMPKFGVSIWQLGKTVGFGKKALYVLSSAVSTLVHVLLPFILKVQSLLSWTLDYLVKSLISQLETAQLVMVVLVPLWRSWLQTAALNLNLQGVFDCFLHRRAQNNYSICATRGLLLCSFIFSFNSQSLLKHSNIVKLASSSFKVLSTTNTAFASSGVLICWKDLTLILQQ